MGEKVRGWVENRGRERGREGRGEERRMSETEREEQNSDRYSALLSVSIKVGKGWPRRELNRPRCPKRDRKKI